MKALSVRQPWANLIASGEKTIETRTWETSHRGNLLIVSSKKPNIYPAGYAIAVVNLYGCRPMTAEDEELAKCKMYDKAVSWLFNDIRAIKPFLVKGSLGIFNVELDRYDD